jgi:hypothetical protein
MQENDGTPEKERPDVTFAIDGVEYTSEERRRTAAELLSLAGVDAADHDLARVVGQGEVEKRFRDDETVQLTPGARFVSIFTGSTPVV